MVKYSKKQILALKTALRWKIPAAQRQRIQMVLLRESGMTQRAIAEAMGLSLSTVNRAHMAFDHGGIQALKPKPIGGRQRENMTLAEEKVAATVCQGRWGRRDAEHPRAQGGYEAAIGHATSNSTIYNLLVRHGWRKLMPRPFHPKRDLAAQHDFKKGVFPGAVRRAQRAPARRGRRFRVMFADEARFGRMNRPRPFWAPRGIGPRVACQLIRKYIYLYGAVCPQDGTCVYLIMPTSNTTCFQRYLRVLSRRFARQDILLVLDGAPNHRCADLAPSNNISLLFLPPYAPELDPKENLKAAASAKPNKGDRSNASPTSFAFDQSTPDSA